MPSYGQQQLYKAQMQCELYVVSLTFLLLHIQATFKSWDAVFI